MNATNPTGPVSMRRWFASAMGVGLLAVAVGWPGAADAADPAPATAGAVAPSYEDLIREATVARRAQRYDDSLKALDQARLIDEEQGAVSMPTHYHRGLTLSAMGRHEEAVAAFTRGVPAQPAYPMVYWERGWSLEALSRKDEARADFERFASRMPAWIKQRGRPDAERMKMYRDKLVEYGLDRKYKF